MNFTNQNLTGMSGLDVYLDNNSLHLYNLIYDSTGIVKTNNW